MSTDKLNSPNYSKLNSWLGLLRFSRGNPFAASEANQERTLLPDYFVDVDGYEQIKGDHTVIIFAPRGGGKSALRVVLASYAAPVSPEAEILAIEYMDFSHLISKVHAGDKLTIDDYVDQLLHEGTKALFLALGGPSPSSNQGSDTLDFKRRRIKRVNNVMPPTRSRLSQWIRRYNPEVLEPEELYERLHAIKSTFAPEWKEFIEIVNRQQLRELLSQSSLAKDAVAVLIAELNDFSTGKPESLLAPIEKLSTFVALVRSCGFKSVHFLIDGLDETQETANDPQTQADILEPLLAELPILELPGAAFKFFLSREAHKEILERPTVRKDRLTDRALTVKWDEGKLKNLLDARLDYFSKGSVQDLVQICSETIIEADNKHLPAKTGEWIEKEMLQFAQESPRRLITAGKFLFEAHISRHGVKGLIELDDWEHARKELNQKIPPLLRLHLDIHKAWIGEREVELTTLHQKILLTLTKANGICDRDRLALEAWGSIEGVSPQAIDKTMSRLREILGDDPNEPTYLKTIRGKGFQLLHFEFV